MSLIRSADLSVAGGDSTLAGDPDRPTASPAIRAVALSKRFGNTVAVKSLSMTVERGEVFGFLGPNGAGKTTMVKMLLGLARPTGGEAMVLGAPSRRPRDEAAYRLPPRAVPLPVSAHRERGAPPALPAPPIAEANVGGRGEKVSRDRRAVRTRR